MKSLNLVSVFVFIALLGPQARAADTGGAHFEDFDSQSFQITINGSTAKQLYFALNAPELVKNRDCQIVNKIGQNYTCQHDTLENDAAPGAYSCVMIANKVDGSTVGPMKNARGLGPAADCNPNIRYE